MIATAIYLKVWADRAARRLQDLADQARVRCKADLAARPVLAVNSVTGQWPHIGHGPISVADMHELIEGCWDSVTVEAADNPSQVCGKTGKQVKDCACDHHGNSAIALPG